MTNPDDLEVLEKARPFIRSIAAFLLFLRFGHSIEPYELADRFIQALEKDMRG